jgi:hypothetical protein
MKTLTFLLNLPLLLFLIVACANEVGDALRPVDGPALIMFYTDN